MFIFRIVESLILGQMEKMDSTLEDIKKIDHMIKNVKTKMVRLNRGKVCTLRGAGRRGGVSKGERGSAEGVVSELLEGGGGRGEGEEEGGGRLKECGDWGKEIRCEGG